MSDDAFQASRRLPRDGNDGAGSSGGLAGTLDAAGGDAEERRRSGEDEPSMGAMTEAEQEQMVKTGQCPVRQRRGGRGGPNVRFSDHFTLRLPTSDVKYRGDSVHVYDLRTSQIQIVVTAPDGVGAEQPRRRPQDAAAVSRNAPTRDDAGAEGPQPTKLLASSSSGRRSGGDRDGTAETPPPPPLATILGGTDEGGSDGRDQEQQQQQQQQQQKDLEILVRDVPGDRGTGLSLLRLTYTVVAFFFTGIVSKKLVIGDTRFAPRWPRSFLFVTVSWNGTFALTLCCCFAPARPPPSHQSAFRLQFPRHSVRLHGFAGGRRLDQ
jgi:hypothetical protein